MKSSVQAPGESGQEVDNAEAKHFQPNQLVKLTKRRKLSSEKMNQPNLKSYEALFIPCWQRWLYNSALNQSNLWRSKSYRGSLLYLELQLKDNYQTVQVFCGPAYHE